MLWIKLSVGGSVQVGNQLLTLTAKDKETITVDVDGAPYIVRRNAVKKFAKFALWARNSAKGLRLGFGADSDISIRRLELET